MKTTTGITYYIQILFGLVILNCFIIFTYAEEHTETKDEIRKLVSSTNVANLMKAEATKSITVPVATDNDGSSSSAKSGYQLHYSDNTKKQVNKRQQFSQAKPIQLTDRRTDQLKKRVESCPLCDSSVFSYCSDKLLHDACCCLNPYETNLPYQCQYADCSFLHANTCREHHLITSCCCDRYLY